MPESLCSLLCPQTEDILQSTYLINYFDSASVLNFCVLLFINLPIDTSSRHLYKMIFETEYFEISLMQYVIVIDRSINTNFLKYFLFIYVSQKI